MIDPEVQGRLEEIIRAELGVECEYRYQSRVEDETLSELGAQTVVMFKLLEFPQDYPGFDRCFICEDPDIQGRGYLLLLHSEDIEGHHIPFGM